MKKLILSVVMLAAAVAARAQQTTPAGQQSEWLPTFNAVVATGSFDVVLVKVPDTEAPRIIYDTKGSYTTKFRAEVKDKVLQIREKSDSRRPERTEVTVHYNDIRQLTATDAAVTFADTVRQSMLDLTLGGYATLTAVMDVADLEMIASGHCKATLSGRARYLTLSASSSAIDAASLETMSARINAQSNATVGVTVTDRLEGRTSTNGSIRYKGTPGIIRNAMKFMAGDIEPLE